MQELKGAILSQNQRRSQRGGPGGPGPLNRNAINDKNFTKKPCFFIFGFFSIFESNNTRAQQFLIINNIDDHVAQLTPLIQFFPTNSNV